MKYVCEGKSFLPWDVFFEFKSQYFNKYLIFIKSTSEEETKNLNTAWQKAKEDSYDSEEHKEWVSDSIIDDAFEVTEVEQLMLKSFVVSIFIFIEETLNEFCSHLNKSHNQVFSVSDMAGMGVNKAVRYIEVVTGKEFPFQQDTKISFSVARCIRNSIVHNDGLLKKDKIAEVENYIRNYKTLEIKNTKLVLSYEYATSLILLNKKICEELQNSCLIEEEQTVAI